MNAPVKTPAPPRLARHDPAPTPQDLLDLDRGEDEGMSKASVDETPATGPVGPAPQSQPAQPPARDAATAPATVAERHARDAPAPARDAADLERRLLGQEVVLESVIAYLAAADPKLLEDLRRRFVAPMQMVQHEQDYMAPEQYAEGFIRALIRRVETSRQRPATPATRPKWPSAVSQSALFAAPQYAIEKRHGIWNLTKFGKFYGHYFHETDAISAAEVDGRSSRVQIEPRSPQHAPRTAE